jgi:hypothetical protein
VIPFERHPKDPRHPRFRSDVDPRLTPPQASGSTPRGASPRPAASSTAAARTGFVARNEPRGTWLIGPMLLFAVAAGVRLVFRGADEIFGLCFALLLGLGVVWILVSVLMPAKADRTCPRCKRSALGRIDPRSTHGVTCRHCGFRDETASAFLLAEEEGPLEDIVLRERQRRRF